MLSLSFPLADEGLEEVEGGGSFGRAVTGCCTGNSDRDEKDGRDQ